MYNPLFPQNYQPINYNQMPNYGNLPNYNQQSNNQSVIWVQGESGAKGYLVGAGQSVLLMDSETSTFYIKSTDQSGMPLPLRIFDYKERIDVEKTEVPAAFDTSSFVTREELEKRLNEFKEVNACG